MTTYVVHDGYVISKTDGDRHFVSYGDLVRLYSLDRAKHEWVRYPSTLHARKQWEDPPNAVHLHPRYDGNYTLPE